MTEHEVQVQEHGDTATNLSLFPSDWTGDTGSVHHTVPLAEIPETPFHATQAFVASVKAIGVMFPVVLERTAAGGYMIRDGNRRVDAARRAGLTTVIAIIVPAGVGREALTLTLNWARERNVAAEFSAAYGLFKQGVSAKAIARQLGQPLRSVEKLLCLSLLPAVLRTALENGTLTPSVAFAVTALPLSVQERLAAEYAETQKLTLAQVREARSAGARAITESLPQEMFGTPEGAPMKMLPLPDNAAWVLSKAIDRYVPAPDERETVTALIDALRTMLRESGTAQDANNNEEVAA